MYGNTYFRMTNDIYLNNVEVEGYALDINSIENGLYIEQYKYTWIPIGNKKMLSQVTLIEAGRIYMDFIFNQMKNIGDFLETVRRKVL